MPHSRARTYWLDNLRALLDKATTDELVEGMHAYARYRATIKGMAEQYGIGLVPAVEAFAALSPNSDYKGNLRSLAGCLSYVAGGRCSGELPVVSTYNACRDRALTYLTGEVSFLDTVKGPKITAFRHNILYPETSDRVTIDGHMILAMQGDMGGTMTGSSGYGVQYGKREKTVQYLSRKLGVDRPHQLQAALWLARKRLVDRKGASQFSLFEDNTDLNKAYLRPEDVQPYPRTAH